jgi:ribosomal small subunit protein bTHX
LLECIISVRFAALKNKNQKMGRGDKRTAKGKRFKGSYGISRKHKAKKSEVVKACLLHTSDAADEQCMV